MRLINRMILVFLAGFALNACSNDPSYDLVIRNGVIYDGSGAEPLKADIAVNADRIVVIGSVPGKGTKEIDAKGMAVAPGFINMLSWATESLIEDGRSISDIAQGVTLEVMGEGWSMGPVNEKMKKEMIDGQTDIKFDVNWNTLNDYLEMLQHKGISTNIASFVGATTLRIHEIGYEDRAATTEEMDRMKELLDRAMRDGALGLGSSLIYAPAFYAPTEELVELSKVVAKYDGMYISHMRSEGGQFLEAIDELLKISKEANIPPEIYHF